jgi:hypothetical protein
MEVLTDLREITNGLDEPRAGMARMRARKTNTLDAGYVVDIRQQLSEIAAGIVGRLIVVHDLPEELDLFAAGRDRVADVREDV